MGENKLGYARQRCSGECGVMSNNWIENKNTGVVVDEENDDRVNDDDNDGDDNERRGTSGSGVQ